ncbi:hypothetical protein PHMEG_00018926 [Phytophthora megakarya]|uniref:Uncharacterized protein n=1 Tax=Phytophthora megakarya TaxID=4795 RepID=A0A225VUD3_9STRA|nr:hypothetical protein PHMEG_00018926 [Phytophthora megakarya]
MSASARSYRCRSNPKAHERIGHVVIWNLKGSWESVPVKLRTVKKKASAGDRADRKWYAYAEEGCKVSGEVSLKGLLVAFDREQPELVVAQRRLAGVNAKYGKAGSI